jgi:predicted Fe-S protein YdhL (DUF1289 family)
MTARPPSPARPPGGPPAPIKTPCVKVCVIDGQSGLCMGCYRRLSEVAGWARLTDAERETILAELPSRRNSIAPEKLAMFG